MALLGLSHLGSTDFLQHSMLSLSRSSGFQRVSDTHLLPPYPFKLVLPILSLWWWIQSRIFCFLQSSEFQRGVQPWSLFPSGLPIKPDRYSLISNLVREILSSLLLSPDWRDLSNFCLSNWPTANRSDSGALAPLSLWYHTNIPPPPFLKTKSNHHH